MCARVVRGAGKHGTTLMSWQSSKCPRYRLCVGCGTDPVVALCIYWLARAAFTAILDSQIQA